VGQEYFINSQQLEDKLRELLPSQGGAGAGFDLSASTQIIPVIDVTESAEGSNVRADLQTAFSLTNTTTFNVSNATSTIINTTGYFRIFGNVRQTAGTTTLSSGNFSLTDGTTTKDVLRFATQSVNSVLYPPYNTYDFVVFLDAGDSFQAFSSASGFTLYGSTRQIATIDGVLV